MAARARRRLVALTAAAGATHNLNQTAVYTALRQRFGAAVLEAAAATEACGWTEATGEQVTAGLEVLGRSFEVSRSDDEGNLAWLLHSDTADVLVTLSDGGRWSVAVAAVDQVTAEDLAGRVLVAFPSPTFDADADEIGVRYWAMGALGPFSYWRRISVTPWADARDNYPPSYRPEVDALMAMDGPPESGRILLWHGPAGTGKTNGLRALAHAWRSWCDVDYIVDADKFFDSAAYMVTALIEGNDDDRWRLVVLEDSGEYLRADANARIGQGLSRLLNLSDGLVGQGLKLLILMTTNESAEDLHPAVTRAGRCLAEIRFGEFTPAEADAWRAARGVAPTGKPASLAELYASTR